MFDGVVSPLANISTAVTDLGIGLESLCFAYLLSRSSQRSGQWWAIAFLFVAIAAVILAIKWTFHPFLSPDAIYHLVQMATLYCFFQGSRTMGDRHRPRCSHHC